MTHILEFLGRLHPLVVHLPIGFIFLGLLLLWKSRKQQSLKQAACFGFFWSSITAIFACLSGIILYQKEGFGYDTVKAHLWMGIITAAFSFLVYVKLSNKFYISIINRLPYLFFIIAILFLVSFTGHLGGNITHGEGYLTESIANLLGNEKKYELTISEENWNKQAFYDEIIQPIFNAKCISCHGKKKDKGGLKLHDKSAIMLGGEDGPIIVGTSIEKSSLYTRLILPSDNDDHMPPKDKKQLTKEEIKLIKTWVSLGTPFDKTVQELNLEKKLFSSFFEKKRDYPNIDMGEIPQKVLEKLKSEKIHVDKVSISSNFVQISCINKQDFSDADFDKLKPIKKHIVVLDISNTKVTDAVISKIAQLPNLVFLRLDKTKVTGTNIDMLKSCNYLKTINLSYTSFNGNFIDKFKAIKSLKKVFLYATTEKSGVIEKDSIYFNYGGYQVEKIPSDTIMY